MGPEEQLREAVKVAVQADYTMTKITAIVWSQFEESVEPDQTEGDT